MKKVMIIFVLVLALSMAACRDMGEDDLRLFKGIPTAEIPGSCLEFRNDVCELFRCTVDLCWCDSASVPSAVLYEKDEVIDNEEQAMALVKEYAIKNNLALDIKRAVKLNNIFYNVFADANGDEEVYTVAVDATIIKTICGV